MTDQRLAWLNGLLRWRQARYRPDEPHWVLCEHCDRVAELSVVDPQRCVVCAPPSGTQHHLAAEVRDRLRRALRAGAGWPGWSR